MELIAPKETQVIAACKEALNAQNDYALKALIAGQLLLEHREAIAPSRHSGATGKFVAKTDEESFTKWIEKQGVAVRTAQRWMQAAERVCRAQLGIPMHETFSPVIEIGNGQTMSMSQALTLPEGKLAGPARAFRQGIFDFMAEHTLSEAATAVVDGESDGKRITLAAGGKKKGGKGSGDRKAFDVFAKTKLKHLTTFMGRKLTVNQKAQIVAAFDAALEQWPRWIVEGLAEKCRSELKLAESDRSARATFKS
jgi:hypothetical protein